MAGKAAAKATAKAAPKKATPKKKPGRKMVLLKDPGIVRVLGGALKAGHYAKTACAIAGIGESTYYALLERGEAVAHTVAMADNPDKARKALEPDEAALLELHDTVRQASAQAELRWVQVIERACQPHQTEAVFKVRQRDKSEVLQTATVMEPGDWKAALELLSRRFPDRWARREQLDVADVTPRDPVAEAALTDKAVRAKVNELLRSVSGIAVEE